MLAYITYSVKLLQLISFKGALVFFRENKGSLFIFILLSSSSVCVERGECAGVRGGGGVNFISK